MNYLQRSSSLKYIDWLPEDFTIYRDFKPTFGFEPTYPAYMGGDQQYFNISLDFQKPLPISGYDVLLNGNAGRYMKENQMTDLVFELNAKSYRLKIDKISNLEVHVSIIDSRGNELVGTGLHEFAQGLAGETTLSKEGLDPNELSFDVIENEYKMKIIFQNISFAMGSGSDSGVDYTIYVLFATPDSK